MKFTFDWLKDHLKTDLDYFEIGENLTKLGLELEEITDNKKRFEGFIVGKIINASKHPNADKLQLCDVDIGQETLKIVCGAKNARPGINVAVAMVGAFVPAFNEKLKKGSIRGVDSFGMLCSSDELLLEDDGIDGIIELPPTTTPGQNLASALNIDDVLFDISITPNRSDCFCVRGIARDLAAIGAGELLSIDTKDISENIENPFDVDIKTKDCNYFSTIAIKNVSGRTPEYIANRLKAIGQKLINLPVDIANYVCIDIGQPLHIFDSDKLQKKILIRNAKKDENIITLAGNETNIPENAIVVANENDPISIAGIIGGESTAFSETSKNVLIECAYFDKLAITRAAQALRLTTDSRVRFERGIDPQNVDFAIRYVANLIAENCKKCQMSGINKYGKLPENKKTIELNFNKFQALTNLDADALKKSDVILEKLGISVLSTDNDKITVSTPSWRHDLSIGEDIIEEILRMRGYETIEEVELDREDPIIKTYTADKLSEALVFNGFFEVKTFSMIDQNTARLFAKDNALIGIKDANIDFATLRPSVVAAHLKSIKNAQNKSQHNIKMFEIGKRFINENGNINEEKTLTLTIAEGKKDRDWREASDTSVFDLKAILERLLKIINIKTRIIPEADRYYHPGRSGKYIFQKDTVIASFGEIHPSILTNMDIAGKVFCFELILDHVPELYQCKINDPVTFSQYQPTTRDFSFIVKKSVSADAILNSIKKARVNLLKNVSIFDVYESESIGQDNKAVAVEVLLQSEKDTLSEEQISNASEKIVEAVSKSCNGTLRDF